MGHAEGRAVFLLCLLGAALMLCDVNLVSAFCVGSNAACKSCLEGLWGFHAGQAADPAYFSCTTSSVAWLSNCKL